MYTFFQSVKQSAEELKKTSTIAVCGLLIALNVVLGLFSIVISNVLQIRFSFLAIAMSGVLYGPLVGGIVGAVSDLVNFVVRPTGPFIPGFTLDAFLTGFLYALVLYKKKITIWRVFAAKAVVMLVVDIFFNTIWLSLAYGQAFYAIISARIIKNLIMLPINTGMLYVMIRFIEKVPSFRFGKQRR
ncbi:MAG: folate family ECF transporter S component [Clostridiales bacterium]|nr:folate family ECF transporter S component [Clostridiales bacterium]